MNAQQLKQNLVYLGVILLAWLVVYTFAPSYPFQPRGIFLPAVKQPLKKNTQSVIVFGQMPPFAKLLGFVHVEGHSLTPKQSQEMKMLITAKNLVQQAGANGLVIKSFGYEGAGPDNPSVLAKYVLFGKAVYVFHNTKNVKQIKPLLAARYG